MTSKTFVPRYYLPAGPVVLDGDIYKFFSFKSVWQFRKELKKIEDKSIEQGFFRLNDFEKYFIKAQNKHIPHTKASAETFAFTQELFLELFPQFFIEKSLANELIDRRLSS